MTYCVLQYQDGIPTLLAVFDNRLMAYDYAYTLAGLPFLEYGTRYHAHIHSPRGEFAVVRQEG